MKSLVLFISGALLFGAGSLSIGFWFSDQETLLEGGVAFALAFVPSAGTLAWVVFSHRSAPEMQLVAALSGSGIRMIVAFGGGFLLTLALPQSFDTLFWYWLVLFYLVLLGLEIAILVWQQPKLNGSAQA
jgi:hypothetical protein